MIYHCFIIVINQSDSEICLARFININETQPHLGQCPSKPSEWLGIDETVHCPTCQRAWCTEVSNDHLVFVVITYGQIYLPIYVGRRNLWHRLWLIVPSSHWLDKPSCISTTRPARIFTCLLFMCIFHMTLWVNPLQFTTNKQIKISFYIRKAWQKI